MTYKTFEDIVDGTPSKRVYRYGRKEWVKDFARWLDFDDENFKEENDDERAWLKKLLATIDTKRCSGCKQSKDKSLFYKNKSSKDGLSNLCKDCDKRFQAEYRSKNRKMLALKHRIYQKTENGIKNSRKSVLLSQKKYPDRAAARSLLHFHINKGTIKKQPCEVCGDLNVHGHHQDYSKPLEVKWLCPKHHRIFHGKEYPIDAVNSMEENK